MQQEKRGTTKLVTGGGIAHMLASGWQWQVCNLWSYHYNENVPLSTLQQPKMTGDDDRKFKVTRNVKVRILEVANTTRVLVVDYSQSRLLSSASCLLIFLTRRQINYSM